MCSDTQDILEYNASRRNILGQKSGNATGHGSLIERPDRLSALSAQLLQLPDMANIDFL